MNKIVKLIELTDIKILYLKDKLNIINGDNNKEEIVKIENMLLKIDDEFNNTFFEIKKNYGVESLDLLKDKFDLELKDLKKSVDIVIKIEEKIKNKIAKDFYSDQKSLVENKTKKNKL